MVRKSTPPPIEEQLTDIEDRLAEIETEVNELEDERWGLERKQEKLEKQLEADAEASQRLAEKMQAEIDERKQRKLLEQRYGAPNIRNIADYWYTPTVTPE